MIPGEDLHTHLSAADGITREKISKVIEELNNTISQQDLINIYTTLQGIRAEYTFLSEVHGT